MDPFPRATYHLKGSSSVIRNIGTTLEILLPRNPDRTSFTVVFSAAAAGTVLLGPTGTVSATSGYTLTTTPLTVSYELWDSLVCEEWSVIALMAATDIILMESHWVHPPETEKQYEAKLQVGKRLDIINSSRSFQPKQEKSNCEQLLRQFGIPVVGRSRRSKWRDRAAGRFRPPGP